MSKSISKDIRHDIDETLEDVAKALRAAAETLSDETEEAVASAAKAVKRAAETLAEKAKPAREMAEKATAEVKEHPIVSAGAALTAAALLISVLVAERRSRT